MLVPRNFRENLSDKGHCSGNIATPQVGLLDYLNCPVDAVNEVFIYAYDIPRKFDLRELGDLLNPVLLALQRASISSPGRYFSMKILNHFLFRDQGEPRNLAVADLYVDPLIAPEVLHMPNYLDFSAYRLQFFPLLTNSSKKSRALIPAPERRYTPFRF
jgi:hypothetical protein